MSGVIVVTGVIISETNPSFTLIQQRGPDCEFANLWETPGGKVETGEDPVEGLKRELFEELGLVNVRVDPQYFLMAKFQPPVTRSIGRIYHYWVQTSEVPYIREAQQGIGYFDICALPLEQMAPSLRVLRGYMRAMIK